MKQSALLLLIFTLALVSCDDMGTYQQPVPPEVAVALAQVTDDAGSAMMQSDRLERESEQATKNAETNMTATHGAYIATATQSAIGTQSAIAAGTATHHAETIEEIEEYAVRIRTAEQTAATVAAVQLEVKDAREKQERGYYVAIVAWAIFFCLVLFFGIALIRSINLWASAEYTVEIEEVDRIVEVAPKPTARVQGVRTRRSQSVDVELVRQPFVLEDSDGRTVHTFDGNALDNMQTYVGSGDIGFRRGTSGENLGMDELAGIRGGDKYTPVWSAMKANGFVIERGVGSKWTNHGVVTVLGMDSLPQS